MTRSIRRSEDYLQQPCGPTCARGGSAQDLLVHNIFHEKQHTGQVWNIRDELRLLQGWDNTSLYPLLVDYYLSRAQLVVPLPRAAQYLGFIFARGDTRRC